MCRNYRLSERAHNVSSGIKRRAREVRVIFLLHGTLSFARFEDFAGRLPLLKVLPRKGGCGEIPSWEGFEESRWGDDLRKCTAFGSSAIVFIHYFFIIVILLFLLILLCFLLVFLL